MRPIDLLPVLLAGLTACTPTYSPNTYASSAVQQASKVEQGVIAGVRQVAVSASGATGAVAGAAAGGIAGAQAPVGGAGSALTALGGSLVGGLVGAGVEHATGDTVATEYIVRKANGELVSVTQRDAAPLTIGQHVLVIAGSQARIVADYTVPGDPAKPAQPPHDATLGVPAKQSDAARLPPVPGPAPYIAAAAQAVQGSGRALTAN